MSVSVEWIVIESHYPLKFVCVCVHTSRRDDLEWLDGEIETICLNSQKTEEVTSRGVGHTRASNRGGIHVCLCVCHVSKPEIMWHVVHIRDNKAIKRGYEREEKSRSGGRETV